MSPRLVLSRLLAVLCGAAAAVLVLLLGAHVAGAASGPDVSNYQHPSGVPIDWNQVRDAGNQFAFVKATEGPSSAGGYYTNPWFAKDWSAAGAAGLYRGAYHFARPQYPLDSAVQQARYFVSVTGTMQGARDLPPVLDLESTGGLPASDLIPWTMSYLSEVERLTGRRPIIYTGYYFWKDSMASSTAFSGYRLWMARYTTASNPYPLPTSWDTWTFWQYTSTASVPGIAGGVDMNDYCCPDTNLAGLAGPATTNPAAGNPFGGFDAPTRLPGAIHVTGWAIDPDTRSSLTVHVYVDGVGVAATTADQSRPELSSSYPGWGIAHGYDTTVKVSPGVHQVCTYAINKLAGNANTLLGCANVVGLPLGSLDTAVSDGPGRAHVQGWAIDPDTDAPINVHVYVDGVGVAATTASTYRPDVAAAYPGVSAYHGYDTTVGALATGWHQVCTYAINVGSGYNTLLGCTWVSVLPSSPLGYLDLTGGGAGMVRTVGWSFDPDTTGPIAVHVYIDGVGRAVLSASTNRPDIGAVFPAFGPAHGYDGTVAGVTAGWHQVCTYGINVGPGQNALLGCANVNVLSGPPAGYVDGIGAPPTQLTVVGWALDPDQVAPIAVQVTVDGGKPVQVLADQPRPDFAVVFPTLGTAHGFQVTVPGVSGGVHWVCVQALDPSGGPAVGIGCRPVLSSGSPIGNFEDAARTSAGTVALAGWTIDPDTTAPVTVHVYVDGVGYAILTANGDRPDVAAAYPTYGPAHGWTVALGGLADGPHQVCAYGINVASGANSLLGCYAV